MEILWFKWVTKTPTSLNFEDRDVVDFDEDGLSLDLVVMLWFWPLSRGPFRHFLIQYLRFFNDLLGMEVF
jgi:hypothetical protein